MSYHTCDYCGAPPGGDTCHLSPSEFARGCPEGRTKGREDKKPYTAADILKTAAELVSGERNEQHGDLRETFAALAGMWSSYLGADVRPADVAFMMAQVKMVRERHGAHNPDNGVDSAGYCGIAGELADGPPTN